MLITVGSKFTCGYTNTYKILIERYFVIIIIVLLFNPLSHGQSSLDSELLSSIEEENTKPTYKPVLKSRAELSSYADSIVQDKKRKTGLLEKEESYYLLFESKIKSNLPDTAKLTFIHDNINDLSATESSLPLHYNLRGLEIAERLSDDVWIGKMKLNLARLYTDIFNMPLAVSRAEEALEHFTIARAQDDVFNTYRVLVDIYTVDLSYDKAIGAAYQVIDISEKMNDDKLLAQIYMEMARNFTNFIKEEQSNEYIQKARELYKIQDNHEGVATSYYYSATNHMRLTTFDEALQHIGEAIALAKAHPSWGEEKYYDFIQKRGEIYGEAAMYTEALADIDYVEQMTAGDDRFDFDYWNSHKRSAYYWRMGDFERSKRICYEIINDPKKDYNRWLIDAYGYLELVYNAQNQLDSAYRYHMLIHNIRDVNHLMESQLNMERINTEYKTKEKEALIQSQSNELRQQKTIKWLGFGFAGLLLLLFIQTYRSAQQKKKTAEAFSAIRSQLYTNMTHEFRTPLTVIMGLNEEIMETTADLEIAESTKKRIKQNHLLIQRNSDNLLFMVNQLLDLAKSESNLIKLNLVQDDIIMFLNYLTESFYSKAEEKNIRLLFYSEIEEVIMDYDHIRIQQVIYNLLSNAIKFSPEYGKIVIHASKILQQNRDTLHIKVNDNGIGIPEDKLDQIFERFYQVDNSQTRREDGSGIGLALTKEIVHLFGGEITVESHLEKGTTFKVFLPITNQAPVQTLPLHPIQGVSHYDPLLESQDIHSSESMKDKSIILLVEDNKDVCRYIEQLLMNPYHIVSAKNGEEGIRMAKEFIPDLIISDVMMPIKDGYELTKTLKQDISTSHIPIILLTAKATQQDKIAGLRIGADAYLTKPFHKQELLIRISSLIENRQIMQQHYAHQVEVTPADTSVSEEVTMITKEKGFINQLNKIIHRLMSDDKLKVDSISNEIGISKSQLYRKIKAVTGLTPNGYLRQQRLYKSLELLEQTEKDISEIAYEVGFSSPSYFSRSFHKLFHKSPQLYRNTTI